MRQQQQRISKREAQQASRRSRKTRERRLRLDVRESVNPVTGRPGR